MRESITLYPLEFLTHLETVYVTCLVKQLTSVTLYTVGRSHDTVFKESKIWKYSLLKVKWILPGEYKYVNVSTNVSSIY